MVFSPQQMTKTNLISTFAVHASLAVEFSGSTQLRKDAAGWASIGNSQPAGTRHWHRLGVTAFYPSNGPNITFVQSGVVIISTATACLSRRFLVSMRVLLLLSIFETPVPGAGHEFLAGCTMWKNHHFESGRCDSNADCNACGQ